MPVVTLFFQTVYAFVIIQLGSRRVVHVNVTAHPTDAWVAQQLREATPFGERTQHLICDDDTKYGRAFHATAKTCGLETIHTPYEAPRANAICERFVGRLRRERLDHVLVLGNRHLGRVLREYAGYFNLRGPTQGWPSGPQTQAGYTRRACPPRHGLRFRCRHLGWTQVPAADWLPRRS